MKNNKQVYACCADNIYNKRPNGEFGKVCVLILSR